jgi:outer membrane immunogenic protein
MHQRLCHRRRTWPLPAFPGSGLDLVDDASADYLITIRPRVGFASGSALIYATGGLAITTLHQSHSAREFGFGPTGTCFPTGPAPHNFCNDPANASDLKAGWTAGGGIEWALSRKWSIKGEYLFTDFSKATTESTLVHALTPFNNNELFVHEADLTVQTVRAGINYKLN